MHRFELPQPMVDRVLARTGRVHPFDRLDPTKTALVVIDMQNYFMKPGFLGEIAMARAIIPAVNRLADGLRRLGGEVIWIKNSTNGTLDSWSTFHDCLNTPDKRDRRLVEMDESHEGHALWSELDVRPGDAQIVKKRFSAFIQGSSTIVEHLHGRGIDTVLIAGTATNICCESSARDAMMLNFKTVMVADALATWTDAEHNATLATFYSLFGDVQTVDQALVSLGAERTAAAA
jgi:ureidoacrylate peracid hydrolase